MRFLEGEVFRRWNWVSRGYIALLKVFSLWFF